MIIHMNEQRLYLIRFFRKQVQASRLDAERDCVSIPTTMEEYCRKSKNPDQLVQENIDMDDLYDDVDDYDDFHDDDDEDCGGSDTEGVVGSEDHATDSCDTSSAPAAANKVNGETTSNTAASSGCKKNGQL